MYNSAKKGWYKVLNASKYIMQTVESKDVMKSVRINEGQLELNYKSSLELKCLKFCDMNKHITKFSLEPFSIKYLKPTTGKIHRYFVDFFIEFSSGEKFLVEIKSFNETLKPTPPKKKTQKSLLNYQRELETYAINISKWESAKKFCQERNMKFLILTEKELK